MSDTQGGATAKMLLRDFHKMDEIPKLEKKPPEMGIKREGDFIVSPEKLTYRASGDALIERAELEERELQKDEAFVCHPNDGLVCFTELLQDVFGWITPAPPTIFEKPPTLARIAVGLNEYKDVFSYGRLTVPGLKGVEFTTDGNVHSMVFHVSVKATYEHKDALNELFDALRHKIENQSIYKGKAIDTNFDFLDLESANINKVVFNKDTMNAVLANVITPIRKFEFLKEMGIPYKRNTLLYGPFGTGKTLVGKAAGREAVMKGITFISVTADDLGLLPTWIQYARRYAPSVLFFEDIDLVASGENRTRGIHEILNNLDGLDSKDHDLMVLMTSNHADRLNRALLRPGRLDSIIYIGAADKESATELVRLYGGDLLSKDFDFDKAGEICKGLVGAFIREVVDRAKLVAITRDETAVPQLIADDLAATVESMATHIGMVNDGGTPTVDSATAMGYAMQAMIDGIVVSRTVPLEVSAAQIKQGVATVNAVVTKNHEHLHTINDNLRAGSAATAEYMVDATDPEDDAEFRDKIKDLQEL